MTTHEDFADWLQAELRSRGWDQAELARRSRVTHAQISRLLAGDRRPGPTACRAIARAFHLPPDEVFRRAGLLPKAPDALAGSEELLQLYRELPPDDRTRLLVIARSLRELLEHT
ncbi:MAG TPA: helix-turn-helix transcriptional regulator [Armatimonadota bacterium]|jgi:transcriptional regulator with XRE-family HTH domain